MNSRAGVWAAAGAAILLVLAGCAAPGVTRTTGDVAAHDPAIVVGEDGRPWWAYSTGDPLIDGGALEVRTSADGVDWRRVGSALSVRPDWIAAAIPGVTNLWAPELFRHGGVWYLYYAASTFGSNHSAIGLATNTTLDPRSPHYRWVDRGPVLVSESTDDYNAIDPAIVQDAEGTPWMAFGSFWSGIRMVKLAWPGGLRADDADPLQLAGGRGGPNAIEAATIVPHGGRFYLFASIGACCRGAQSTYQIIVGRSSDVAGPYLDRGGVPMTVGGGTIVLSTDGDMVGPGGESQSHGVLAFHYYDAAHDGATRLATERLAWDSGGWPDLHW